MVARRVHAVIAEEHEEGIVSEFAENALEYVVHLLELRRHARMSRAESVAHMIYAERMRHYK